MQKNEFNTFLKGKCVSYKVLYETEFRLASTNAEEGMPLYVEGSEKTFEMNI